MWSDPSLDVGGGMSLKGNGVGCSAFVIPESSSQQGVTDSSRSSLGWAKRRDFQDQAGLVVMWWDGCPLLVSWRRWAQIHPQQGLQQCCTAGTESWGSGRAGEL